MTREEEIEIVHGKGTHVVLLGAGASFASTLRNPEKSGKKLPLMWNIIDIVGLNDVIKSLPMEYQLLKEDFEKLYSKLVNSGKFDEERKVIDTAIHSYFAEMGLPDEPTIYDYLILSLRHNKDVIATFNWDPFLYEAMNRNKLVTSPHILFLHGNVSIGYDKVTGKSGPAGGIAYKDYSFFEPTQLLYPVESKDYNTDPYIKGQWGDLSIGLENAERVTVFGYSAPVTDVEAIDLLQKAWGMVDDRAMEEFEFIDVKPEDEVIKSWKTFVHSHHYRVHKDYFDSSLAQHPRRTVESYHHWAMPNTINEAFQDGNPVPRDFKTLEELWEWHRPLIEVEKQFYGQ